MVWRVGLEIGECDGELLDEVGEVRYAGEVGYSEVFWFC